MTTTRSSLTRMQPRDPHEAGRTSTPLELFFDLVFVVAVSVAAVQLHHALSTDHLLDGVVSYAVVFFGIWWAWMNFTWFATAFGTDDWLYRLVTFVQMAGVLVLAAGIEAVFEDGDFTVLVLAYVVMRVALVAQWLRASRSGGAAGRAARSYALGVGAVQVLWLLSLLLPDTAHAVALAVLVLVELAVPVLAELRGRTPWHAEHLAERYGLFAIIVLGEGLLVTANTVIEALHDDEALRPLLGLAVLTVVTTAALWWTYFWPRHDERVGGSFGGSLAWGYGHYLVFASAAAFSAGVEVQVDVLTGESEVGPAVASLAVTVPLAVFLLVVWLVALRHDADRTVNAAVPAAAALLLLDPLLPVPLTVTALALVVVVVLLVLHPPVPRQAVVEPDAA